MEKDRESFRRGGLGIQRSSTSLFSAVIMFGAVTAAAAVDISGPSTNVVVPLVTLSSEVAFYWASYRNRSVENSDDRYIGRSYGPNQAVGSCREALEWVRLTLA